MQVEIQNNLDNPGQLEKLYRANKSLFKKSLDQIYAEQSGHPVVQCWHERLHYESRDISWGSPKELGLVLILAFFAGLIAKIPDLTGLDADYFYPRNLGFIFMPLLIIYFAWRQSLDFKKWLIIFALALGSVLYINILPGSDSSDTFVLACMHLPLFMWALLGFSYCGDSYRRFPKRIAFLRFNGDLVVMTTLIVIAGVLLSVVTIGLFELINLSVADLYFRYFGIWGLAATPIIGAFLVQVNPQLVKQVSPVIARVFTPLVLVMLVVYLLAIVYTGKDPYNDRDFLLIFNLLLLGVMAIIFFSITEIHSGQGSRFSVLILLLLSILTIVVNAIALSAIVFRISEWGITPNRLAVLGSNMLILINLMMVASRLLQAMKRTDELQRAENSIAVFLPVYAAWTVVVSFLFPVIFNFR